MTDDRVFFRRHRYALRIAEMEIGDAARELLAAAQRGDARPGSWMIPQDAWLEIERARDTAGLTVADIRPPAGLDPDVVVRHTFRHTAITHLVQAGVDLPTVQKVSGHKTLAMAGNYSHANGAHIDAAMDKLEGHIDLGIGLAPILTNTVTPKLHKLPKAAIG